MVWAWTPLFLGQRPIAGETTFRLMCSPPYPSNAGVGALLRDARADPLGSIVRIRMDEPSSKHHSQSRDESSAGRPAEVREYVRIGGPVAPPKGSHAHGHAVKSAPRGAG